MLGENRPAVGRNQLSAVASALADNVSVTADDLEAAVRVATGLGANVNGDKNGSARGKKPNVSGRGQQLPPPSSPGSVAKSPSVRQAGPAGGSTRAGTPQGRAPIGGALPTREMAGGSTRAGTPQGRAPIGGALPTREMVKSRLNGGRRKSVQMLLRSGSRNWRQRIQAAKKHARFAIITVRRFVAASQQHDSRERLEDFFGRLCPIMTDLLGADAPRFAKAVQQIEEFLRRADEPAAAAAAKGAAAAAEPPRGVLPAATLKDLRRKVVTQALQFVVHERLSGQAEGAAASAGPAAGDGFLKGSALLDAIVGDGGAPRRAATSASVAASDSSTEPSAAPSERAGGESASHQAAAGGASKQLGDSAADAPKEQSRRRGAGKHIALRTKASMKDLITEALGNISEEDVDGIAATLQVMQVHVENANAKTNPMKPWNAAPATDMAAWGRSNGGEEIMFFTDAARAEYIEGAVAVHVDCSGEGLQGQLFQPGACPYALAKLWSTPQPLDGVSAQQIRGLPIGQRQLAVLSLAAEKALGKLGRNKLRVVLTVDPKEEEAVLRDLQFRNFYGFVRENVILLTAVERPGARFNPRINAFEEDEAAEAKPLGPGFSLKQLAFTGEAYNVAAPGAPGPKKQPLPDSALGVLSAAGVRWLSTWRCGDLGRLSPEDALDLAALAFALREHDGAGAEAVMQVAQCSALDGGVVVRPHRVAQKLTAPGMSCAIAAPRVQTPAAMQSLQWIREADWAAPCGRWIFRLEALCAALGVAPGTKPTFVWSPTISLSIEPKASGADGHPVRVNPSLHVADLPMLAGLSVSSYRSPLPVVFLTGLEGGDTLLRVAGLQDRNVAFQAFIHRLTPGAPLAVVAASAAQHRFDVVLLVHEGPLGAAPKTHAAAFRLLAQLLRAGEDTLHLVYFAQDHSELARAQKVLDGFAPDDNPMLAVTRKVLVTTDSIPVALDNFADAVSAQVVVVAAGTSAGGGVTLGSVAMTVAKRSIFPVLVAKPDLEGRVAAAGARLKAVQDEEVGGRAAAGFLKGGSRDAPGIRVLLGVETGSIAMELIGFCAMLLRPMLDTLILCRCKGRSGTQFESAGDDATLRLIGAIELIARRRSQNLRLVKRVLDGKAPLGLVEGARRDGSDLLVLQAPQSGQLESDMMDAVAKAKGAVLVFRRNPHLKLPEI